MLRISAIALLCLGVGCVGDQSERWVGDLFGRHNIIEGTPVFVRDENKPGQPVIAAYLSGTKVTDAALKDLADLKQLEILDLRNASVSDAGLKELGELTQLRELYLIGDAITDAGLKQIAAHKKLEKLYLVGAQVTDAGLKNLANLKELHELNVSDTLVTAAGERELQKALPNCQVVR
jgi:hypothetical protein